MSTSKGVGEFLLLDTHIWIWLMSGHPKLNSPKFLKLIDKKVSTSSIQISAISVWEIAMLEARGRLSFPLTCSDWIHKALNAPGISLVPLSPEIAIESSRLPDDFHGDPADRIIVATARILGATLVTQDTHILNYSKKHHLRAISVFG